MSHVIFILFGWQTFSHGINNHKLVLIPCGGLTTHRGDTCVLEHTSLVLGCSEEGYTFGVWLESESILIELPKVSEVATNHWVFFKVWLVTDSILFLLPILGRKKVVFPNLIWMDKKSWFLSSEVWLCMEKVLGTCGHKGKCWSRHLVFAMV